MLSTSRFYHTIKLLILSCVVSATCFLAACKKNLTPAEKGFLSKTLLVGIGAEPTTLDSTFANSLQDDRIISGVFEGLVNLDGHTLEPKPGVAQSWDISPDGLTYTFHLRNNATWSNGDTVTAHDFVFTYQRLLSPDLGAPFAFFLHNIVKAKDYNENKITDFNQVGIKALDDHTLELKFAYPTPYFLSLLGHFSLFPLHRPTLEKFDAVDKRNATWTRPENIVSNGPFTLKFWKTNNHIEIIKNPNYWNASNVKLNAVHLFPTYDLNAEERSFRAGQLHITQKVPTTLIRKYIAEKSPFLRIYPIFGTYFLTINTAHSQLKDVRVRQALSLAIDRQEIVDKIFQNGSHPAYTFVPKGIAGYNGPEDIQENIEKARQLLAEAGYPNGQGLESIELAYNTEELWRSLCEGIQSMWKKNLNINSHLINKEWKVFVTDISSGNFAIARLGWIGDVIDPYSFLSLFQKEAPFPKSHWINDEYDRLMQTAEASPKLQERFELYKQAETILLRETPLIPFADYTATHLVNPHVKGLKANLRDRIIYNEIEFEE
jgi:oligopeptide transport system substrate-binding protein